jgi:hypothetical protein
MAMKGLQDRDAAPGRKADADVDDRKSEAVCVHDINFSDVPKEAQETGCRWWHRRGQVSKTSGQRDLRHTGNVIGNVHLGIGGRPC